MKTVEQLRLDELKPQGLKEWVTAERKGYTLQMSPRAFIERYERKGWKVIGRE